jgi:DNA-directed RNA polymerase subunit N (RpoN/RPB10)
MALAGRKEWVQADLRCMMCGRVIGRLVGPVPAGKPAVGAVARHGTQFAAFRPADASVPAVRLMGDERFRCTTCGGSVIIDELERFSTYAEIHVDDLDERPRRGRPPKPWRHPPDSPDWLEQLGIAG